jgi:Pyruvate/2-oxoacid:ferredoxin oxidoreductase delta subunit
MEDVVLPSQVVEYFIENARYHWIMDFCICRDGDDCQSFPKEYGCIFLGEAVQQINTKVGRLVSKNEALAHAQRCRNAGLVHMIGRNKLDSVWLGVTPSENLLTICNCCPCCCLWKIIPFVTPRISDKVVKMPGVQVTVNDLCIGCEDCTQGICFVDSIYIDNGRAVIGEECRGCGRCVDICPIEAIEIRIDDPSFVNDTIEKLSPLVNIS